MKAGEAIGAYRILDKLGEGGMGQVYRARDTKLDRDVAIKILPEVFAHNADRLARFQREAKTLASLNHPNIAAIYGVEDADGTKALVMELVEGDDLSQRIAQRSPVGRVPRRVRHSLGEGGSGPAEGAGLLIDEALPIAKQIAEALEAAHEQGVIHRDLKPANIKVRPDGTVKVLDFGLAKAMGPAEAGHYVPGEAGVDRSARLQPGFSQAPTITTPALMTGAGIILGTAAYMSPEQARGNDVDKRADLWAFGVVLFEMLTSTRLFEGATVSDTLAFVLTKEPDWTTLPAKTPAPIRRLLRRCLEKDRKRRLDSAAAARLEIEEALSVPAVEAMQVTAQSRSASSRVPWIALAAIVLLGVIAVAMAVPTLQHLRETPQPLPAETRTEIFTPATESPEAFALSPDGRQIVFVASGDDESRLWLRSLATTTAVPLAGTEGARTPFWSPDGRSIAFFTAGALRRLDLGGGTPQTLATITGALGRGGSWNADGVILFGSGANAFSLMRVPASGGAATAVTTLGPQQLGHAEPHFLPDGRRFLFYVGGSPEVAGIHLGSLDETASRRLTTADSAGLYLPSGPGLVGASRGGD